MINLTHLVRDYNYIFVDLDNTLFNYTDAHNTALSKVLTTYNISLKDYENAKFIIKKRDLQANHHKKELYFKVIAEMKNMKLIDVLNMQEMYNEEFNKNILTDSAMYNLLKYSKENNKTIVAITNYYVIAQLRKLKSSGYIDFIDYLVTSEEFEVEKPNKKLFDRAVHLSGAKDLSKIIMFGDSTVDDLSQFGIRYYPYNCSKLMISVSGKSGAGKSTISKMLREIWDAEVIEGDGYHKYDRYHDAWKNITHYNPEANNLIQLSLDIKTLYQDIGKIHVPIYNHDNGMFDAPNVIHNKDLDVIIIEGLHTLYPEVTGDYVKIKMFIDSELADKQKIARDTKKRGKTEEVVKNSINQRQEDYNKYISIQKEYSNFLVEIFDDTYKITLSEELSNTGNVEYFTGKYSDLINTIKSIMIQLQNNRYKKDI